MKKDYYGILGLKQDCNAQDIKKQYYNLALRWHPDKHHDKFEAESKFNEIREAYSVLIDPQEKKFYDRYGYRKSQDPFDDDESFSQNPFGHLGKAFRQWNGETIDLLWDIISDEPEEKRKKNNQEHYFNKSHQSSKVFNQLKRTLSNLLEEHFDDDATGFFEEFIPDFEEFEFRANFEMPEQQQQQMKPNEQQPKQMKNNNPRSASPQRMFFQASPSPSQNFAGNSKDSAIIIEDEEPNNAMIIEEDSNDGFFAEFSNKLQGFQSSLNDFHQNIEGHFMRSPLMNASFQFYFQNQSC